MIGFFIGFLTVVLALVCLLMVFIVLMQKPKQEGLGAAFGGGVTDSVWGADASNILQKITVWLAVMFFVITMVLAVLVGVKQKAKINSDQLTKLPEKSTVPDINTSAGLPAVSTTPPPANPITTDPIQILPVPTPEETTPAPATEAPKPEETAPAPGADKQSPEEEKEPAAEKEDASATQEPAEKPADSAPGTPTP